MRQPKIPRVRSATIGAVIGVAAMIFSRAIGTTQTSTNNIPYWFGVALGGALIGIGVAAVINLRRT